MAAWGVVLRTYDPMWRPFHIFVSPIDLLLLFIMFVLLITTSTSTIIVIIVILISVIFILTRQQGLYVAEWVKPTVLPTGTVGFLVRDVYVYKVTFRLLI